MTKSSVKRFKAKAPATPSSRKASIKAEPSGNLAKASPSRTPKSPTPQRAQVGSGRSSKIPTPSLPKPRTNTPAVWALYETAIGV